ncbi:hypothetical protein HPB52_017237 [Rhipicephalus sanguineus]|uniref:Uncharacterized protein n=1 Tax=Rhipicephalus sanguineus TaxID=34632 RepID=A0A9D4PX60_RHISA|nr:hypothetical protein HPB52_017237 [Rhipicephalus sanguineus]
MASSMECCFLKVNVTPSQRTTAKPYEPWVLVNRDGTISPAHCTCVAGIDGAHSEEDAGALVEVSCYVITAIWLTSKAFGHRRKEARKVAGLRDPLEEDGTLGASLKEPTARVAGMQRVEGAWKRGICKRQVPIVIRSALRSGKPCQDSQRQHGSGLASGTIRRRGAQKTAEHCCIVAIVCMDDTDNSSDAGVSANALGRTNELKLKIEALKLELEIEKCKSSRASQDAAPSRSERVE